MAGETDLDTLLAGLDPVLHPEVLVWCSVPHDAVPEKAAAVAFARIVEEEGTTLIVPIEVAERLGLAHEMPSRRIELRVHSDLAAVGLTAAVAGALAAEGISANVIAAFHHDHVLAPEPDAADARDVLRELTGPPVLRPATADDAEGLWLFVGWAGHALGARGDGPEDPREVPKLRRYVEGFGGRPGDVGVVAVGPTGRAVGAAWARPFVGDERADETYVDDATPEVAIACRPSQRGRGVGDTLLVALADAARAEGHTGLVLSVREGNPARRLYERHGFVVIGTVPNRIGGRSTHMLLRL